MALLHYNPLPMMLQLASKSSSVKNASFRTPPGCCIPFGTMELAIAALPGPQQQRYKQLLQAAETAPVDELESVCEQLQVSRKYVMDAAIRIFTLLSPARKANVRLGCQNHATIPTLQSLFLQPWFHAMSQTPPPELQNSVLLPLLLP